MIKTTDHPHGLVLRIAQSFERAGFQLYGYERIAPGRSGALQPVVMEEIEESAIIPIAATIFDPSALQILMDDLWQCGIRPTDGAGTAGSMRSTERHLNDMRALVAKYTKTELP